ncbi:hypothetical protein J4468_03520 [Candidatus Woesearchaeota archaeon]|nr:hypothetical protein [Candidatus Woesearchaeota archaeon]
MYKITEVEGVKIKIPKDKNVSKKMPVFYNPIMKLNRDISVDILKTLECPRVCLPMEGTGLRGIRFKKEMQCNLVMNDISKEAYKLMKANLKLNKIKDVKVFNKDANILLRESEGFDYIDIDPFGNPSKFLDAAMQSLARKGILAVTATDTSALSGTFPKVCKRSYWARSYKTEFFNELGLRILIRKIQLIGTQYNKALIPLFSYSIHHYSRAFMKCEKSKIKCDEIIKQHKYLLYCKKCLHREISDFNNGECCGEKMMAIGPLWAGKLKTTKLPYYRIDHIEEEIDTVGYYELHRVGHIYKTKTIKTEEAIFRLKKAKIKCSRTHFSGTGVKAETDIKNLVRIIQGS